MKINKVQKLFHEAQKVIRGGNSPVRAFRAWAWNHCSSRGPRGKVYDADGRLYRFHGIVGPDDLGTRSSPGPQGHDPGLAKGWSYGAATELEVRLAQKISKAIPSLEMVRMVSSGTEAP